MLIKSIKINMIFIISNKHKKIFMIQPVLVLVSYLSTNSVNAIKNNVMNATDISFVISILFKSLVLKACALPM